MCGIVGVYYPDAELAPRLAYYALFSLQHRGQESAGLASYDNLIRYKKGMGLVTEVFSDEDFDLLAGRSVIGHVRYSTTGLSRIENAQPFVVKSKAGFIAVAHNGNLVNYTLLRNQLENEGRVFTTNSDTEIITQLLSKFLLGNGDVINALENLNSVLIGSYTMTMLVDDTLIGYRDPVGFKPLCVGELDDGYIICSESCAIDALGGKFVRDVEPGEAVIVRDGEIEFQRIAESKRRATCIFEYIYFARPDSIIDGISVYEARTQMGKILARESPVDADYVSAVPDSGITAAIGYAEESGLPYMESLIKNRYVGRTFIMPAQTLRELSVRLKVNVVRGNVEGKKIVLVDDSIVRGTTSKRIIEMIKNSGAKEVHVRIGSPPIVAPCYFGIDMKTREELIAANHTVEEIGKIMGADSLAYLSLSGLLEAIKKAGGRKDYCLACLTERYPVPVPGEIYDSPS
ncbi:amidophosphoribosyltransferase [Archaeoglobus neptunius]|uniref:amidophosphoribosyltransferase n=1 Tax=Archaeoglobus neptunius TaxID=2798580 RepID=UPI0019256B6D|nr:amidophosphoribosyltransferase [Archaeoglobus neptunius]